MIKKLLDVLSEHKDYLETLQGKVLYVADWKDESPRHFLRAGTAWG